MTPPPPSAYSKAPRTRKDTTSPGKIRHPTPPPPPPSQMSSPPSAQNSRRRKPHNNWTKRCPRYHHHQPRKKNPAQSPSPTPLPQWSSPRDRNGFRDLPRERAVHNGRLRWDEITPGLQAIRLHSIDEPTATWALPTGRHHLLLTVQGDATITPTEGDPVTAAPAHAVHIPPQASSAPMTVHPGPTPWQAIVITYPAPNDQTHTW